MQHVQHAALLQPQRPPAHSLSPLRPQPHTACTPGVVAAAAAAAATPRQPQHRSSSNAAATVAAHAQAGEGPAAAGDESAQPQQQQPRRVRRLFRGSSSSSTDNGGPPGGTANVTSSSGTGRGSSSSSSPSVPTPPPPPLPPGRRQQPPAAVGAAAAPGRASTPPPARSRPPAPPPPAAPSDFLEDFAAAFESRAVAPNNKARQQPGSSGSNRRSSNRGNAGSDSDYDSEDLGYLSRDPALNSSSSSSSYDRRQPYNTRGGDGRSSSSGGGGRAQLFGRPSGSSGYGKLLNKSGPGWGGRGKAQKGGKGGQQQGMTLEDFDDIDVDTLSPAKQELLAKLRAEADEAERRRLLRKARSEAIPTKPKPRQDPVVFQAMTREWDEKMSLEEKRGARAAARQIARVGIYDRNRALKAIRRKVVQAVKTKPDDQLTEEDRIIAQRAIEIREAAAAKSIQPSKEELAQAAMGVARSYARAEALPEGMWEELKNKYRSEVVTIKLGRRGATPQLATAIQNAWRSTEVVKLRIHDDKSSRKMNLPRMNLLLRELEEGTGGVLLDATGSSIWLFRGVDWSPPPPPPVYKPPPPEALLQQQYTPKGTWVELGGVTCYVVSSSSSSGDGGDGASSSSSSGGGGVAAVAAGGAPGDAMTVLMLPDHFSLDDSRAFLQVADKVASSGALVVLADVLGAPPDHPNSNTARQGAALARDRGTNYWPAHRWPLVKKRKLEYMAFYQSGPGSWVQQRPRLLQLLEAMQQQGIYNPGDAGAAAADASSPQEDVGAADSSEAAAAATGTSNSSSSSGRPLALWGTGWGSFIGLQAAGDDAIVKSAGVRAMVAISPATYNKDFDIAQKLQVPVALLPAKYDTMDQVMMFINLLAKPWELRCIFKRYGKVKPGWASWLPQWSDERAMRQIAEQQLTAVSWLKRELLGVSDGYELPEPQLPATAGSAMSQAQLDAAAKQEADAVAAELAEAAADAE